MLFVMVNLNCFSSDYTCHKIVFTTMVGHAKQSGWELCKPQRNLLIMSLNAREFVGICYIQRFIAPYFYNVHPLIAQIILQINFKTSISLTFLNYLRISYELRMSYNRNDRCYILWKSQVRMREGRPRHLGGGLFVQLYPEYVR